MCNIFFCRHFFHHLLNKIKDNEEEAAKQASSLQPKTISQTQYRKQVSCFESLKLHRHTIDCLCGKVVGFCLREIYSFIIVHINKTLWTTIWRSLITTLYCICISCDRTWSLNKMSHINK